MTRMRSAGPQGRASGKTAERAMVIARSQTGTERFLGSIVWSAAWLATLSMLVIAVSLTASPARGSERAGVAEVAGVEFPERHQWGGEQLRLHGTGVLRYRLVFKGYAAALYLGDGVDAERVLEDVPRRIEIEYFWPIPAKAFADITWTGMSRNLDEPALAALAGSIEKLNSLYEDVRPGDRYALTYVPGIGTELALNGSPKGLVEGADFSAALFAIWLGEEALDESLRDRLLAQR